MLKCDKVSLLNGWAPCGAVSAERVECSGGLSLQRLAHG